MRLETWEPDWVNGKHGWPCFLLKNPAKRNVDTFTGFLSCFWNLMLPVVLGLAEHDQQAAWRQWQA